MVIKIDGNGEVIKFFINTPEDGFKMGIIKEKLIQRGKICTMIMKDNELQGVSFNVEDIIDSLMYIRGK